MNGPGENQTTTSFHLTILCTTVPHVAERQPYAFLKGTIMSMTGTVKFFNTDKGYGFIQPDDGSNDSFVHISAVQAAGMHSLDKDQRLNYEVETGRNGKASAVNLSAAA